MVSINITYSLVGIQKELDLIHKVEYAITSDPQTQVQIQTL